MKGILEYWNTGILEYWNTGILIKHIYLYNIFTMIFSK
jgi:hypothetical protein